jgi:hypothetical protein
VGDRAWALRAGFGVEARGPCAPGRSSVDDDLSRGGDHFLAASLAVEAPLRVAYELQKRHLPNVLAHGVLSLVMSDLVEAGALAHPADVHGIADTVRRMPATRFDDYIAAVAARGPLVPVSSGGGAGR